MESSMTEQQRHNRRRRAKGLQLEYLRQEFQRNPRPDKETQYEIGRHIDMTRRSVQIWFQNNRAKLRNEWRVKTHRMGQSHYTVAPAYKVSQPPYSPYNNLDGQKHSRDICGPTLNSEVTDKYSQVTSEVGCDKYVFACDSLTMGSWRRTKHSNKTNSDLIVECDGIARALVYYVIFNGTCFRAVVSFDSMVNASICPDMRDSSSSYLIVQVNRPPDFSHRKVHDGMDWKVCEDFTSGEAVSCRQHWLRGPTHKLTENLQTLRFMRCQEQDIFPPYQLDCHSEYDLAIGCEDYEFDESPPRSALARSQSVQSKIDDEIDTSKSELRMSRQMSMPNLAHLSSPGPDEVEPCDASLEDLEMLKPFSSAPPLELTLPKSRELSAISSPSPIKEELDLLPPLSLQSSRAESPICSKQGEFPIPSIFSKSDTFFQNRPSTPLEANPSSYRPMSPLIPDNLAMLAQECDSMAPGVGSFWDDTYNC